MGWANCGIDSTGRPIGYAVQATCDEPGCGARIDRGLSYSCGPMHGENAYSCERYFCSEHLHWPDVPDRVLDELSDQGHLGNGWCKECCAAFEAYYRSSEYGDVEPRESLHA